MRVLQVGYGTIGRQIAEDYARALCEPGDRFMAVDLVAPVPSRWWWDGERVDVVVVVVDTPRAEDGGYDYSAVLAVLRQYEPQGGYLLVRSTVAPDFLEQAFYRAHRSRIGFQPEFTGATKWNNPQVFQPGMVLISDGVPDEVAARLAPDAVRAQPAEVMLAKLADNAYLALKVTFFHELALAATAHGVDPEAVRAMVASDPRVGAHHTFMEEPGWQSHCLDKDVPVYADVAHSALISQAILVNQAVLLPRRAHPEAEW